MAVTDHSVTSRTVAQHIGSVTHHSAFACTIRRRSAEWSVRKTSIAWSTLDAEPQTSPLPMPYFNRIMRDLTWHALSKGSSSITRLNSGSFTDRKHVEQRLSQITPRAATPDQLGQRVKAAWSVVPQEHIKSLFESMPRRVAAVISNNGGYSGN
ncbi:uncharacterized protein TNCV_3914071 [Trichonephila clavipes]|nr:uncharacterized protein TNCV_3914071 [Trichonephila clavipes]